MLDLIERGCNRQLLDEMPDFMEQSASECKDGSLTWLMGAMDVPQLGGIVHGYGTVIGTGNAVVEWRLDQAEVQV